MKFIVKLMAIQPDGATETEEFAVEKASQEDAIKAALEEVCPLELNYDDTLAVYAQPVGLRKDDAPTMFNCMHADTTRWYAYTQAGGKRSLTPAEYEACKEHAGTICAPTPERDK